MEKEVVQALADNVRRLMADRQESQAALAGRAGLSQRVVGDLLTYGRGHFKSPTLRTVTAISEAYGVPTWMILLPGLPIELLKAQAIKALLTNYIAAPADGRTNIDRIAEAEVRYARAATESTPARRTGTTSS